MAVIRGDVPDQRPKPVDLVGEIVQLCEQVDDDVEAQQADQAEQVGLDERGEQDAVDQLHERGQRPEVRGQRSEVRGQRSEVRGSRAEAEVRGQRSEVRGQRSEVRGQRSEVRGQRSGLLILTSDF